MAKKASRRKSDHILTRNIGNLKGFSTVSSFLRTANIADKAVNMMWYPDETLAARRGYQCQMAAIGGLGIGTYHSSTTGNIETVTLNFDGNVYKKLDKKIYFYYDGVFSSTITNISQASPAQVTSNGHTLITGTQIVISGVNGMVNINDHTYTITVIDANNFTLDGIDSTAFPAYISGGFWAIASTLKRYLNFTIFTDPRYLESNEGWDISPWDISPWGSPTLESITSQVTANFSAQVNGNQNNTNTFTVRYGHDVNIGNTVVFDDNLGVSQQRQVTAITTTSITVDGFPTSVVDGQSIANFYDVLFLKGFDSAIVTIQDFIDALTGPLGIFGLAISANGDTTYPAAFLQILEPMIVNRQTNFQLPYHYWQAVNRTLPVTFPGSADIRYQNAEDFEVASTATYNDVLYFANGIDFPQKYDDQNIYLAGMPKGQRIVATSAGAGQIPTGIYNYAISYEQVDNIGNVVEGEISDEFSYNLAGGPLNTNVLMQQIQAGSGYNTDCAQAVGGLSTVYGPDINGFYYNYTNVLAGHTLKYLDNGFYTNTAAATKNGASAGNENTFTVNVGYAVVVGDFVSFIDTTGASNTRLVTRTTPTTITVDGVPVQVGAGVNFLSNQVSKVYGHVAIVDGNQNNQLTFNVVFGHSLQPGDQVFFTDTSGNLQRRNIVATTLTTITIDPLITSLLNRSLIYVESINGAIITLQTKNPTAPTLTANSAISNNLRINIYRTEAGGTDLFLLFVVPNNSFTIAQIIVDSFLDANLGENFEPPARTPNPPPISKYLRVYGNQMLYAGGERNVAENDDAIFFSEGGHPETLSLTQNVFTVPSTDDIVTGVGVAGTTLIITKNRSLYYVTGNLLTSQFQIQPIAPGSNKGCVANATIVSVGSLMYFLDATGVYACVENQMYPTDSSGNPIAISEPIDLIFRQTNFIPKTRYQPKRAIACNYNKDQQYLLFMPCEDPKSTIRAANEFSTLFCYDYQEKNWFSWENMNAAGGLYTVNDNLFFQERRASGLTNPSANLYKQHRFYRLVDHADHAGPQRIEWRSSWEDLGYPEVRKKFVRCMLLMNRLSEEQQFNFPKLKFSSYIDRVDDLPNTIADVMTVNNVRNAAFAQSPWSWGIWSGIQDTFVSIPLKSGTTTKSLQVGFKLVGINMDFRFAGFQLEVVPENRITFVR